MLSRARLYTFIEAHVHAYAHTHTYTCANAHAYIHAYRATPDIRTQPLEPRDTRLGLWILEPTGHSSQLLWTQDRQS